MKDKELTAEKIRAQYEEQPGTGLDELKALDARVKKPARVFGYTYGTLGAMVLGSGMSLIMTEIGSLLGLGETLLPGIAIGVAGLAMTLTTYPIYKKILKSRKKKYAAQILELSARLEQE